MAKESKTTKKSQDVIFGANEEIRRAVDKLYVKKTSAIMTAAIFAVMLSLIAAGVAFAVGLNTGRTQVEKYNTIKVVTSETAGKEKAQ